MLHQTEIIKDKVTMSKKCTVTGEEYSITVPLFKHNLWKGGALIQDTFPELSLDQREFMISGFTPEEFNNIFAGGDEEED